MTKQVLTDAPIRDDAAVRVARFSRGPSARLSRRAWLLIRLTLVALGAVPSSAACSLVAASPEKNEAGVVAGTSIEQAGGHEAAPAPADIAWTGLIIDPTHRDRATIDSVVEQASAEGRRLTVLDSSAPTEPVLDIDLAGGGLNDLFADLDAGVRLDSARQELDGHVAASSGRDVFGALTVLADLGYPARAGAGCTVIVLGDGHHEGYGATTAELDPADPNSAQRFVSDLVLQRLVPDLSGCSLGVSGLTSAGSGASLVELWEVYAAHTNAELVPVSTLLQW